MLAMAGSSQPENAFVYTLTHASSKVFIFLLFGFIIGLNNGVRDLRKMGGFLNQKDLVFFSLVGLVLLSSLPLVTLAVLKDSVLLMLHNGTLIGDFSGSLLMLSSFANYFYMYRLFFKIFFGDALGSKPSYLSLSGPYRDLNLSVTKQSNLALSLTACLLLALYLVFYESSIYIFFFFDYGFYENRPLQSSNWSLTNSISSYSGYSNSFFFVVSVLLTLRRLLR